MSAHMNLEPHPSDEQKQRLENWLTELLIICRKYRILLDTDEEEPQIVDMDAGTVIGFGVSYLIGERGGRRRITAYDCTGSILDGVWLVDAGGGSTEQRLLGPVGPGPAPHQIESEDS